MSVGLAVADLARALKEAPAVTIQFSRTRQIERYRSELYKQNSQHSQVAGRYRTMREGLKLTIIRIG